MTTRIVINEHLTLVVAEEPRAPGRLIELAEQRHLLPPQLIRTGGMISEQITIGNWWYEPLISSNIIIPKKALEMMDLILKSGISIQGFIIGHEIEAPAKPKTEAPDSPDVKTRISEEPKHPPEIRIDWESVGFVLTAIGGALGMIQPVIELFAAGLAQGMPEGFCLPSDPALIVVLDSSEWWSVFRWYTSDISSNQQSKASGL